MENYSSHFKLLPDSIKNLILYSVSLTDPQKIVLFGSRARGDHRENSDYDIAYFGVKDPQKWTQFRVDSEEQNITLLKTDLVLFDEMNSEYQANIKKEGVTLYER